MQDIVTLNAMVMYSPSTFPCVLMLLVFHPSNMNNLNVDLRKLMGVLQAFEYLIAGLFEIKKRKRCLFEQNL